MKVPINFMCSCGKAGQFLIDEDNPPPGLMAMYPCYEGADHSVFIQINSLDKVNRQYNITVSIKSHEPTDY